MKMFLITFATSTRGMVNYVDTCITDRELMEQWEKEAENDYFNLKFKLV